ncbi:S8 family peptidase [Halobaculum sp. EA56]|uniref:S8 family peptidase n=1 Tax=Halobaculum sp. EA56 TaxID=3421648 RepID=UPI003EB94E0A
MNSSVTRRAALKAIATAAVGVGAAGVRAARATPAPDRYVVDTSTVDVSSLSGMEVRYDFGERLGFAVVSGPESRLPSGGVYARGMDVEIEVPRQEEAAVDAREVEDPFYRLQWDKREQRVKRVHTLEGERGAGARIGIVDDGVLGANPDRDAAHPDLGNVRSDLSANLTDDGNGPGPLNDDHGTHCAGVAAAGENGTGVVGTAPEAEIVDLRAFSGGATSFADIVAAVVVGAAPEGTRLNLGTPDRPRVFHGAGCDVLNLSVGTPPLVPVPVVDEDGDGDVADELPDLPDPYVPVPARDLALLGAFVSAAGAFAVGVGALPVASAGNSAVDLGAEVDLPRGSAPPVVLPAGAPGYLSVGATGPIGFGWPANGDSDTVAGVEVEAETDYELPPEEVAFYSNYGAGAVDVTAGGGNFDTDTVDDDVEVRPNSFLDLVFNTGIANLDPDRPNDAVLDEYVPGYAFKAGTSFAAPNVSGLAALLYAADPDATPLAVRRRIEATARPLRVGRAGQTTAPGVTPNVADDDRFDGDRPSNPASLDGRTLDPERYRGEGHYDVAAALAGFGGDGDDDADGETGDD